MSDVNWERIKMSDVDQTDAMVKRLNELFNSGDRKPIDDLFRVLYRSTDLCSTGAPFTVMRIINEILRAAKLPEIAKIVDKDTDELKGFCRYNPPPSPDGFQR